MDNSCSESDVSISPSHILEKLDMLRQLQTLQRGKLLRQRLDYQNTPEVSSSITEIVSHFSNSTTYNTFKSLLQSTRDNSNEETPRNKVDEETCTNSDPHRGINVQNVIEGVSALNLSQESECFTNSPISSRTSNHSKLSDFNEKVKQNSKRTLFIKEQLSLDEMPIQSPKKNFEELIIEELKHEQSKQISEKKEASKSKKQFLKRGEGMARFGIKKNDLIIQNTKSLPWRKKTGSTKMLNISSKGFKPKISSKSDKVKIQISLPNIAKESQSNNKIQKNLELPNNEIKSVSGYSPLNHSSSNLNSNNISRMNLKVNSTKEVYPNVTNKNKNWAAVLTTEQNDFLRQLKQSDYYKNFSSPTKSVESDFSCSESISKALQCKETAEQNLFDLIENKVSHDSFNINNSFFGRFISKSTFECSGESTPLVMQKCLAKNPGLMHLSSKLNNNIIKDNNSCSADETCTSECTDCSDCCSESTCCSCQTVTKVHRDSKVMAQNNKNKNVKMSLPVTENRDRGSKIECQDSNDRPEIDKVNANMVEMNAKLIATSDILKERLCELEDEIETFRKENSNITKMREELDLERQKFYEEKSTFEQKFNEEKILSEYHLAEEREKLMKQKQMYERYVRDMRGRLNKKEKEEVASLKKEILDLKDEIRLKDAKSTSTIARLRNQLKLTEKDKKTLEEEVEKLKKENQRIHHRNEVTRRLTNIKYLEQINKKLSTMASRETKSEVDLDPDVKYKAYEIEKQSKLKTKGIRTRAKSVPNLNVTSKYAKYFSQKDSISEKEKKSLVKTHIYASDNHIETDSIEKNSNADNFSENEDNYLEKIYNERFKSNSPSSRRSSGTNLSDSPPYQNVKDDGTSSFFLQNSNFISSNKRSLSPINNTPNSFKASISKSSTMSETIHHTFNQQPTVRYTKISSQNRSRSPVSIMSNNSTNGLKPMTVIRNDAVYSNDRLMPSPEPTSSISITKSNLNPVEIMNSNGTRELRFPNGNVKIISANGKYSKFKYYNGDIKENFYDEGRVKYFYAESKTYHTTHADGLEVLEFPDGQVEKRYKDGSSEIRLPNGMVRYFNPKNDAVREEWRYPDGTALTISANGERHITFSNGQIEVHAKDHKRREFPDGTVKLVYRDGTSETRYASGRVRIKDKHGNLVMDSGSTTNHSTV